MSGCGCGPSAARLTRPRPRTALPGPRGPRGRRPGRGRRPPGRRRGLRGRCRRCRVVVHGAGQRLVQVGDRVDRRPRLAGALRIEGARQQDVEAEVALSVDVVAVRQGEVLLPEAISATRSRPVTRSEPGRHRHSGRISGPKKRRTSSRSVKPVLPSRPRSASRAWESRFRNGSVGAASPTGTNWAAQHRRPPTETDTRTSGQAKRVSGPAGARHRKRWTRPSPR